MLLLGRFSPGDTERSGEISDKEGLKRGTYLTFSAIRALKENIFTFCLHQVLIKCRVTIIKFLNISEIIRIRKMLKTEAEGIKIDEK